MESWRTQSRFLAWDRNPAAWRSYAQILHADAELQQHVVWGAVLADWLQNSPGGRALEILNVALSCASAGLYVVSTYFVHAPLPYLRWPYLGCAPLFIVLAVLRLYARPAGRSLLSMQLFVDVVSVVACFSLLWGDAYWPRAVSSLVLLRLSSAVHLSSMSTGGALRIAVFQTMLQFSVAIIVTAAVVQVLENVDYSHTTLTAFLDQGSSLEVRGELQFHNALYLMTCTVATVCYGDIYVHTLPGRVVLFCFIVAAIVSVPRASAWLIKLWMEQRPFRLAVFVPGFYHSASHVVVTGAFDNHDPAVFIQELLHDDHSSRSVADRSVVLLARGPPSRSVLALLAGEQFGGRVCYLDGDPSSARDLERAAAAEAQAIFFLSCEGRAAGPALQAADALLVLEAQAAARCVRGGRQPICICMQLSSGRSLEWLPEILRPAPSMLHQPSPAGSAPPLLQHRLVNQVVLLDGLRLDLLVHSPGVIAFICNMLVTRTWLDHPPLGAPPLPGIDAKPDAAVRRQEYMHGAGFEVYRVGLSRDFGGATFSQATATLWLQCNALVLLSLELSAPNLPTLLLLNPGPRFIIPHSTSDLQVRACVIARNRTHALMASQASRPLARASGPSPASSRPSGAQGVGDTSGACVLELPVISSAGAEQSAPSVRVQAKPSAVVPLLPAAACRAGDAAGPAIAAAATENVGPAARGASRSPARLRGHVIMIGSPSDALALITAMRLRPPCLGVAFAPQCPPVVVVYSCACLCGAALPGGASSADGAAAAWSSLPLPAADVSRLEALTDVHLLRGDGSHSAVLLAAGVRGASRLYVLQSVSCRHCTAGRVRPSAGAKPAEDAAAARAPDALAVMTFQLARRLAPGLHITLELNDPALVRLTGAEDIHAGTGDGRSTADWEAARARPPHARRRWRGVAAGPTGLSSANYSNEDDGVEADEFWWMHPSFASGAVYLSSILSDVLLAGSFHNPVLSVLLGRMLSGWARPPEALAAWKAHFSARVNMFAGHQRGVPEGAGVGIREGAGSASAGPPSLLSLESNGGPLEACFKCSHLDVLRPPACFVGGAFRDLFLGLLPQGVTALALLRNAARPLAPQGPDSGGTNDEAMGGSCPSFVYTNPLACALVRPTDLLIALVPRSPPLPQLACSASEPLS